MTGWMLIIALGGIVGQVTDIKMKEMPEAQCKQAVEQMLPLKSGVNAVCIGPEGQHFGFKDLVVPSR